MYLCLRSILENWFGASGVLGAELAAAHPDTGGAAQGTPQSSRTHRARADTDPLDNTMLCPCVMFQSSTPAKPLCKPTALP